MFPLSGMTDAEIEALFDHKIGEKIKAYSYVDGQVYRGKVRYSRGGSR